MDVVVVTGHKSGIGKAIADRLISNTRYAIWSFKGDVDCLDDWKLNVEETRNMRVWAVVNCAGIAEASSIFKTNENTFINMFKTNCLSIFHSIQTFGKKMIDDEMNIVETEEDNWKPKSTNIIGHFVNITSISALTGFSYHSHYCASKFAANGLSQVAAKELAQYGICVNCVCPGPTDTPMWDKLDKEYSEINGVEVGEMNYMQKQLIKRIGQPEDTASMVEYLISKDNKYITGTNVKVCGGNLIG